MRKTIVINSETMGKGEDELGQMIQVTFFTQVSASDRKPDAIIFYNAAVKLLTADSPALDALNDLFRTGVDLIACGTCVAYFELKDKIVVGRVSNMQEIVSILLDSDSVVTI